MSDSFRINGNAVSWGSFFLKIDGERFYGVTSVSYDHKRERALGWGMDGSGAPTRRSRGKWTPGALKCQFYKDTAQEIRRKLAALSPSGTEYGYAEVDALLQYVEGDAAGEVEFGRVVYVGVTATIEEGPELVKEEIEFGFMTCREDGLTLYAEGT